MDMLESLGFAYKKITATVIFHGHCIGGKTKFRAERYWIWKTLNNAAK